MTDAFAQQLDKVTNGSGEEMAKINRAMNFSLITGQGVGSAYNDHDILSETVNEKKTFFGELQKARANEKHGYHPLRTFNPDAPAGVDPVTGTTAKDHAMLLYPLVKGFIDTGYTTAEGINMGLAGFFDRLDKVGSFMGRHLGGDEQAGKGGLFRDAAGFFQNNYEFYKKNEKNLPAPIGGASRFVGETAGSAPFGIASFIIDKAFSGPASAQSEVERQKAGGKVEPGPLSGIFDTPESEAEFWAFTKGAIERGLMGAIFHSMAGAPRSVRVPVTGALFGEQAHSQGVERTGEDYWKAVITGGLFGTMGGRGKFTIRDIADEIVKLNAEMGQRGSVSLKEGQWWSGRDIQGELNKLPKKPWENPRDFIKEGYVPITRAEADNLFKNGLDEFVARVNIKGAETTGEEGLFMRPLSYQGYEGIKYDKTPWENKEAKELYGKYKARYLQGNAGNPDITSGRTTNTIPEADQEGLKSSGVSDDIPAKTTPQAEAGLIQEAKKYKTVEEFVNAQGIEAWHGSRHKIEGELSLARGGEQGGDITKNGFTFSTQDVAEKYRYSGLSRDELVKMFGEADAKAIEDRTSILHGRIKMENPLLVDASGYDYKSKHYTDQKEGLRSKAFTEYIKQMEDGGHDGIIFTNVKDTPGKKADTTVYFIKDKNKFKTEEQLTHIWNKAHQLPNPSRPPEVGGQSARKASDILKDINTMIGKERGSISGEELSQEAKAARDRLAQDLETLKAEAKAAGKDLRDYMAENGIDAESAELLLKSQATKKEIPEEPIDDINHLLTLAAKQDKAAGELTENPSYEAIRLKAAQMAFEQVSKKIDRQRQRQAAHERRAGEDSARLMPVNQAIEHIIKAGGLSKELLSKDYDKDTIKELSRKRPGLVSKDGGMALDIIADQFGFESGDVLLNTILEWQGIKAEGQKQAKDFEKFFYDKINQNDLEDFHIKTLEAEQKILAQLLKGNEPKPATGLKQFIRQETGQVRAGELAVTEYGALTAGMKKAAAASRVAFREGKIEGAYAENQRQLEMTLRAKARAEAKAEIGGIIKDLKEVSKQVKTMTPGNADKVQELLDCIDLTKLSTRKQLQLEATRRFLADNPNTEMPSYVFDDLARLDKTAVRDLTYDELKSLHVAIMQYAHNSELAQKIYDGREMRDKAEVLDRVIGEMKEPGEKTGGLIRLKPTMLDKISSWSEWVRNTLGIRQDSFRLIVESISGPNSTVDQVFGREINKGNDARMKYRQDTQKAFREDLAVDGFENGKSEKYGIKNITKWLDEYIPVKLDSGVTVELMRGQVMALYRHSLNADNRAALVEGGFGIKRPTKSSKLTPNDVIKITDNDIDRIVTGMKPEELAFAGRAVDNLFENQWQSLKDVFVRVNHYRPDKQDNYYPKDVLPVHRGGMLAEVEEGMEQFRNYTARVGIHKGFLIERVGSKAPIYLNHIMHDITNSIEKSAAYVGLEEPMRRASTLLYNKDFQLEISQRYNPSTWKLIEGGLKDVAGQGREFNETETGILKLRTNAVSGIVALNPWIWMNQPAGFLLFNSYVEGKYLTKGLVDTALRPSAVTDSLRSHSPMLVDRMAVSYDRDLSKQFTQSRDVDLYGGKTSLVQKGISPTKYIDVAAIIPGMQAATYKALAEFERGKMSSPVKQALGMTDAEVSKLTPEEKVIKAHEFADWVVENTQAMAGKEHQSPMQRGGTVEQIVTSFGSQTNAMLNLSRRTYRQWRRTGDPEDLKTFTKAAFQIFLVNAAFMYGVDAVRNALYDRENKTVTEGVVDNAAGMVFILRDIEKMAMSHMQEGRQGFDVKYPVTRIYDIMANMAVDMNTIATSKNQKKIEEAWLDFLDQIVGSAALVKGLPYETPKRVGESILLDKPPQRKKDRDGAIDAFENELLEDIGLEE